jgi:hypothetical protein
MHRILRPLISNFPQLQADPSVLETAPGCGDVACPLKAGSRAWAITWLHPRRLGPRPIFRTPICRTYNSYYVTTLVERHPAAPCPYWNRRGLRQSGGPHRLRLWTGNKPFGLLIPMVTRRRKVVMVEFGGACVIPFLEHGPYSIGFQFGIVARNCSNSSNSGDSFQRGTFPGLPGLLLPFRPQVIDGSHPGHGRHSSPVHGRRPTSGTDGHLGNQDAPAATSERHHSDVSAVVKPSKTSLTHHYWALTVDDRRLVRLLWINDLRLHRLPRLCRPRRKCCRCFTHP